MTSNVLKQRYAEVVVGPNPATDKFWQFAPWPGPGSHRYACYLTSNLGKWDFHFDGDPNPWFSFTHEVWEGKTGDRVDYVAEIYHKKTQMVGKPAPPETQKCQFTECQYRTTGQGVLPADLTTVNIFTDDNAQWGAELVDVNGDPTEGPTDRLNIWDKKPPWSG